MTYPLKWPNLERQNIRMPSAVRNMEQLEPSYIANGNEKYIAVLEMFRNSL